jgi:hypothetical protein
MRRVLVDRLRSRIVVYDGQCVAFVRGRCVGSWLDCGEAEMEGAKGRWDDRDSRWGDIVMISMYDGWVTNWNTG